MNKYPTSETTIKYLPNLVGSDSFLLSRIINNKLYKFIVTIEDNDSTNDNQLTNIIKSDDNIFKMISNIQVNKLDDVIADAQNKE
jgi:hypothetical protein